MELQMATAPQPVTQRHEVPGSRAKLNDAHDRLSALHHMNTARVLVAGALASIEHACARRSEITVEQQAPWIIGELEHAVGELRRALSRADGAAEIAQALECDGCAEIRALPAWKPSLHLSAVRALNASVNGHPHADTAAEAFREQLFVETGISGNLVSLLKMENVL